MGADKTLYSSTNTLSQAALDLVQFDRDSIRQMVASRRGKVPNVWLADPSGYERNGRILRDNTSPRLLGFASEDRVLYVTDGCNTCTHPLGKQLGDLKEEELQALADEGRIDKELLQQLAKESR